MDVEVPIEDKQDDDLTQHKLNMVDIITRFISALIIIPVSIFLVIGGFLLVMGFLLLAWAIILWPFIGGAVCEKENISGLICTMSFRIGMGIFMYVVVPAAVVAIKPEICRRNLQQQPSEN